MRNLSNDFLALVRWPVRFNPLLTSAASVRYLAVVTVLSISIPLPTLAQPAYEPVSEGIDSYADEQNPVISPDGQRLYFTRRGHVDNVGGRRDPGDIWYVERTNHQSWSLPKPANAPLNNVGYNGVVGFDTEGRMLVHGHYQPDGTPARTQGISATVASGSSWQTPEALDIPYYYTKSRHRSGSLHLSNKIMLVTLQSYDTRGGEDLYVLFRQSDGSWTEPKNLGSTINTPYQEMAPYLAPDGRTLYFSSNGYEGFGSRDVYVSVRLDDTWRRWSNPKNLGATVNSEGTELGYYVPDADSAYAYLSSTQNSDGRGDLVKVAIDQAQSEQLAAADTTLTIPMPAAVTEVAESTEDAPTVAATDTATEAPSPLLVPVQGTVVNQRSQEPVAAEVTFRSVKKDTTQTVRVSTQADGTYRAELPTDDNYALTIAADNFIRKRDQLSVATDSTRTIMRDYALTPIEVGATVNLENVLFDRGNASMLPGSYETLDEVASFLQENPTIEIEVAGHTDNRGRADLNLALSEERAAAVKQYLVEQGVDSVRIAQQGYGGTRPLVSNAIEEERSKNRRVEFTIVKK